jgi:hypothetical protein
MVFGGGGELAKAAKIRTVRKNPTDMAKIQVAGFSHRTMVSLCLRILAT